MRCDKGPKTSCVSEILRAGPYISHLARNWHFVPTPNVSVLVMVPANIGHSTGKDGHSTGEGGHSTGRDRKIESFSEASKKI
jgi:hypothetical protein